MHWHSFQLTILVHNCYNQWNSTYIANTNYGENKLLTKYHYFISDDVEQTRFSCNVILNDIGPTLLHNIYLNEHIVWLDGCATQFKFRHMWYHVTR
jgi:hypothetical protein